MPKVYDCKCDGCKAEFQAVLDNEKEVFECPSCNKKEISRKESDVQLGCGGGCGGCGGSCH